MCAEFKARVLARRCADHRPRPPELDARSLGIARWPYSAYYRIEGEDVWIVHIRDDRRPKVTPSDLR